MRRSLPAALAAALLFVGAAQARVVRIPAAFSAVVPQIKRHAHVAVRLPSRAALDRGATQQLYATGKARRGRYDLELAGPSRCGGANACFIAAFTARSGQALGERSNVRLARGLRGVYHPLSCGASCSPPSIAWVQGGVRYDMQIRIAARRSRERAAMVALANSAILSRPR